MKKTLIFVMLFFVGVTRIFASSTNDKYDVPNTNNDSFVTGTITEKTIRFLSSRLGKESAYSAMVEKFSVLKKKYPYVYLMKNNRSNQYELIWSERKMYYMHNWFSFNEIWGSSEKINFLQFRLAYNEKWSNPFSFIYRSPGSDNDGLWQDDTDYTVVLSTEDIIKHDGTIYFSKNANMEGEYSDLYPPVEEKGEDALGFKTYYIHPFRAKNFKMHFTVPQDDVNVFEYYVYSQASEKLSKPYIFAHNSVTGEYSANTIFDKDMQSAYHENFSYSLQNLDKAYLYLDLADLNNTVVLKVKSNYIINYEYEEIKLPDFDDEGIEEETSLLYKQLKPFIDAINKKLPILGQFKEIIESFKYDYNQVAPSFVIDLSPLGFNLQAQAIDLSFYEKYRDTVFFFMKFVAFGLTFSKILRIVKGYFGGGD